MKKFPHSVKWGGGAATAVAQPPGGLSCELGKTSPQHVRVSNGTTILILAFQPRETTPAPSALPPFLRGNFSQPQALVTFSQPPCQESKPVDATQLAYGRFGDTLRMLLSQQSN